MKIGNIFRTVAFLALSAIAVLAQGSYSGPRFSAMFNGAVSTRTYSNPTNVNTEYSANDGTIRTSVTVRTINHPIAVNFSSTHFYRAQACTNGTLLNTTNDDYYQGHPFSYSACAVTFGNVPYYTFERAIVVDATTVIFIDMDVPQSIANGEGNQTTDANGKKEAFVGWVNFENSLNIQ